MATTVLPGQPARPTVAMFSRRNVALGLLGLAIAFAVLRPLLPLWMVERPDNSGLFPYAVWLDAMFLFIQDDLGIIHVTRAMAAGLEALLDVAANLFHGKYRWPFIGPIPWTAFAAVAGITGYYLGGWRMAVLGAGTFIWAAMIGQWKIAMETMAVIAVAAPTAFLLGLILGTVAWKYRGFDRAMRPVLAVLQTLPFFTYLLPAVIFFKVGATAGGVATIVYAMPPMILMTTLGLQKVSPEVVEAGKMAGCSRWQMLRHVYIPSARTEILVGVNQVFMLCLAMVVLTAFIGMPGLGGKLLAMMNSFKLGRSFEIGVTIVLFAVMLDRLSRAWAVKQPEHFERGTPWWQRHIFMILTVASFAAFVLIAFLARDLPNVYVKQMMSGKEGATVVNYAGGILDEVTRRQSFTQGRQIDKAIKSFLDINEIEAVTEWLRWFLNVWILIPFRNALLWLPIPTVILAVGALGYAIGGLRSALFGAGFFAVIASTGWWDRSIITLYTVIAAVVLATLIGLPLAIWAARGAAQPITLRTRGSELVVGLIGLAFKRIPVLLLSLLISGLYYFYTDAQLKDGPTYLTPASNSLWVFLVCFAVLWWLVRRLAREKVMLVIVDTAQTFPSFIYLIPAIMLFGTNDVAVVFSILIFTLVPLIRYTIEGLRNVPVELTEAADMAGATRSQKLWKVQLPIALPTMAVGFNQAVMFAFFMVIIAAFIGTQDLGQELQRTLAGTDLGKNFVLGFCLAMMALVFDHIIMRWSADRRRALGVD